MRRVLLALLVLGVVGYLLTGVVQVRRGERAVVRRFGRVLEYKPEPGLWVGLPWGMDRVDTVAVDAEQSVTVGYQDAEESDDRVVPAGQLLTGDHNLVNVQVVLLYKARPEELADYVTQADRVPGLLSRLVESAMAAWVAGRGVDDVLLNGKTLLRADLLARVRADVEPYRLGVEVRDARVALVAPPDEVKEAFEGVARAQTQIATSVHKAEQDRDRRLRGARARAYGTEQAAAAYAHARALLARRDADRFEARLRQYTLGRRSNPQYLRQLWDEERGRLFARMKQGDGIDLLDHRLSADGLDLFTAPLWPKKD